MTPTIENQNSSATQPSPLPPAAAGPPNPAPRKLRSDSVFAKLSPAQHYTLRRWLREHSYTEVLHMVARPAPEGFGILTHINSLHRYFRKHAATEWLFDDMHLPPELLELADRAIHEPSPYHPIPSRFIERRLMHFAEDPECNVKGLTDLYKLVLKDKDCKFKEMQFAAKHPEVAAQLTPKISTAPSNDSSSKPYSTDEGDLETIDTTPEAEAVPVTSATLGSPVALANNEPAAVEAATAPPVSAPSTSAAQPQEQSATCESVATAADANVGSNPIQSTATGDFPPSSTLFHALQPYSTTASLAASVHRLDVGTQNAAEPEPHPAS